MRGWPRRPWDHVAVGAAAPAAVEAGGHPCLCPGPDMRLGFPTAAPLRLWLTCLPTLLVAGWRVPCLWCALDAVCPPISCRSGESLSPAPLPLLLAHRCAGAMDQYIRRECD